MSTKKWNAQETLGVVRATQSLFGAKCFFAPLATAISSYTKPRDCIETNFIIDILQAALQN
jgi:hypothetical protein